MIAGIVAAFALAIAAWVLVRRQRTHRLEHTAAEQEAEWVEQPQPSPVIPAEPSALPAAAPLAAVPAAPATAPIAPLPQPAGREATQHEPLALAIIFSAPGLRLSLVYATLQYQLEIMNTGADLHGPLHVRADLTSAHATLATRDQLAPSPGQLEAKHILPQLASGESAILKGEVRVALQHVRPVVKGQASFLVPLVRFCILADDGAAIRRVFTAGPRDPGSGAIASVRLDAGPRNLRDLDVREIEAARSFTLDLAEAAG